jgi:hypothetical protein
LRGLHGLSLKWLVTDAVARCVGVGVVVLFFTFPFHSSRELVVRPTHVQLVQGGGEQAVALYCDVSDHRVTGDPHYTFGVGQPDIDVADRVKSSIRMTIDAPEGIFFTPPEWVVGGQHDQTVKIRTSPNLPPGSYVARVTAHLNDRPYLVSSVISVDIQSNISPGVPP